MTRLIAVLLWVGFSAQQVWSVELLENKFPTSPDPSLTPGTLCSAPSAYRYPERVAYCNRSVGSELKKKVIEKYDSALNFNVSKMDRGQFKIDHYIPLCMGGGNDEENLWPQHESIYVITDKLEQLACDKMAKGKLLQHDAVDLIRKAKNDLKGAPEVIKYVERL